MKNLVHNKIYIEKAKIVVIEAEKLFNSVKNCIEKSEMFPIYLDEFKLLIDNLMYLNIANNVLYNEEHEKWMAQRKQKKKSTKTSKVKHHLK